MYARWDPASDTRPKIEFSEFVLNEHDVDAAIIKAKDYVNYVESKRSLLKNEGKNTLPGAEIMQIAVPDHVLSIKCLSDHRRNATMNTPSITEIPEDIENLYNHPQQIDQGEKSYIPDPLKINNDLLLEEIAKFKIKADQNGVTDSIVKAIKRIEEELSNKAPQRGILTKKRGIKVRGVNTGNIKDGKRVRIGRKKLAVQYNGKTYDNELVMSGVMPKAAEISALDKVEILTTHFGEEYAKDKPKYTKGIVKRVKGRIAYVLWEDQPDTGKPWRMQTSRLRKCGTVLSVLCDLSMNSNGVDLAV
jgi:hypothetical protein